MTNILIILGVIALLWLVTIRFFTPIQGETSIVAFFNKHLRIVGVGIPEITIRKEILPETIWDKVLKEDLKTVKVQVDDSTSSLKVTMFPQKIVSFPYKYKKIKTLKEVERSNGEIRWQPDLEKKQDGTLLKTKNDPTTLVLGEWTETKRSLFVRERDQIGLKFKSGDGVSGMQEAYIKYIVWNMSRAISSVHNFKDDPEKAIQTEFASYAKDKDFITQIQGFNFRDYAGADDFLRKTNEDIWMTGILVEDIEFGEVYLHPDSRDIIEKQEKIKKAQIDQKAAVEEAKTLAIQGKGEADKTRAIAEGTADAIKITAVAEAQRVEKVGTAENAVAVDKDKQLKKNETDQFREKQDIQLRNNGVLIDKLAIYKGVIDKTEVKKWEFLGKLRGTLVMKDGSTEGSSLDDKLLENNILGNTITNKQKPVV